MTNYRALTQNKSRGRNKKDGATGRRQRWQPVDWEAHGFTRLDWNKFSYSWQEGFPVFRLAPGMVGLQRGLVARCAECDVEILFEYVTPPQPVKDRLDDEILAIMRRQAEVEIEEIDWAGWEAEGLAIDIDSYMQEGGQ